MARNHRGGGGGGGQNKVPATGVYTGKAGEALSNQDPEQYIRDILGASGMTQDTGTPYGQWANDQLVQNIMRGYHDATGFNQSLSPEDYIRATYGAGYSTTGKKKSKGGQGKTTVFNQGTLGNAASGLADQYADYQSNTDMEGFLRGKGVQGGGILEGGGNSDFQNFYTDTFTPGVIGQLNAARMQPEANAPTQTVPPPNGQTPAVGLPPGEPLEGNGNYRGGGPGGRRDKRRAAQPGQVTAQGGGQPAANGGQAIYGGAQGGGGSSGAGGAAIYGAQAAGGGGKGKGKKKGYNTTDNPAPYTMTPPQST